MHPVCICPWHRRNGVTMAAGFDLLPLDCGRRRSSGDAGLTFLWLLFCESVRLGSPEETAESCHLLNRRVEGCAGVHVMMNLEVWVAERPDAECWLGWGGGSVEAW